MSKVDKESKKQADVSEQDAALDPGLKDPDDFALGSPKIAESEERQRAADEIAAKQSKRDAAAEAQGAVATPERLSTTIPGESAAQVAARCQSMARPRIKVEADLGAESADPTNQSGPRENTEGDAAAHAEHQEKMGKGAPENKSK